MQKVIEDKCNEIESNTHPNDLLFTITTDMHGTAYEGTAPTDIQHLLGISGSDKAIILSVVREDIVKTILNAYEDKYFKTRNGKGVAFTIPMKSLIGVQLYNFLANIKGGQV